MKFTANRESLAKAVADVLPAVNQRSPKEVLQNVRISASDSGGVGVLGTDMETSIQTEAKAELLDSGCVLIPAHRLALILKESTSESVAIETLENNVHITLGSSDFKLPTADPDEYPTPQAFGDLPVSVKARALAAALQRTVFCCDPSSNRFALGGVLFELADDGLLQLVATDGRRLAHVTVPAEGKWSGSAIVPQIAASAVSRLLPQGDETITFGVTLSEVMVKFGKTVVRCRQVEGRFPNWRQVIPEVENYAVQHDVPVPALHSCLRQASIVADAETRGVDIKIGDGLLTVSASASDLGKSRIQMPVEQTKEPTAVRMDYRYVSDFLRYCGEESCRLNINNKVSPALLQAEGYEYVVMPMSME